MELDVQAQNQGVGINQLASEELTQDMTTLTINHHNNQSISKI